MAGEGTRFARSAGRTILTALLCALAASCSSTSDGEQLFGFSPGSSLRLASGSDFNRPTVNSASTAPAFEFDEDDPVLPRELSVLPLARPGGEQAPDVAAQEAPQVAAAEDVATPASDAAASDVGAPPATVQASAEAQPEQQSEPRSFLAAFFSPAPQQPAQVVQQRPEVAATAEPAAPPIVRQDSPRPLVAIAAAPQQSRAPAARSSLFGADALPGVRQDSLFQISRRSGLDDDDSDIDLHEMPGAYRVASASGMARLAPNGLRVQGGHVDVACLQPSLVRMLNSIERHFGRRVIVTSGFRSPENNRRARGARNSLHMYCAAADIQVEGVTKWQIAEFVRGMPGRGGVGTYCHTESVHIDVGPERDWNWRCRRRN